MIASGAEKPSGGATAATPAQIVQEVLNGDGEPQSGGTEPAQNAIQKALEEARSGGP